MNLSRFQRGNATLLTVFLFAAAGLTVFGLFNVGQQTTTKVRLQTVSDAAAHSVATVVARDLNFKAYTNRAMVANQIAIAQIVGVASWAKMFNKAADNLHTIGQALVWVPYVGQFLERLTGILEQASEVISNAIDRAAPALIEAEEFLIDRLADAQFAFHGATVIMAKDTLEAVTETSDSDIDTSALAQNGVFWGSFMRAWEGRQERYWARRVGDNSERGREHQQRLDEFRDVTKASGDRFVNQRSYSWFPALPVIPLVLKVRIEKYGGSELMQGRMRNADRNNYQWTAMDSVGIEFSWFRCNLSGCGYRSWEEVPGIGAVGWGAAHALVTQSDTFNYINYRNNKQLWGRGVWELPTTSTRGWSAHRNNNLTNTKGLRQFYDLKDRGRVADDYINLQVLLLKRKDRVRTMNTVTANVPEYRTAAAFNVEEKGGMAGDTMAALAKAGVYFYRPNEADWVRDDRKREYGNLYNPYWQVRLMPTTNAERSAGLAFAQVRM